MKARDVKTREDFKQYLRQIGAQTFVVSDHRTYQVKVYDKNSNARVNVYIHDSDPENEFWYMNGFGDDGVFKNYGNTISRSKDKICRICWAFSRRMRA